MFERLTAASMIASAIFAVILLIAVLSAVNAAAAEQHPQGARTIQAGRIDAGRRARSASGFWRPVSRSPMPSFAPAPISVFRSRRSPRARRSSGSRGAGARLLEAARGRLHRRADNGAALLRGAAASRSRARSRRPTPSTPRTAVAISAGLAHTCAILDNGRVRCWGFGGHGELGYGNTESIGNNETPGSAGPVHLGAGRTAVAISAGWYHTCVILDNGRVRCWGDAGSGQLGYGNTEDIGDDETPDSVAPVDLGPDRTAVAISAGKWHTCAILDNGRVRCWGLGHHGVLGYGNTETIGDDETPDSVSPIRLGGPRPVGISAGDRHTCVILENRRVRCWGAGELGQLGSGNRQDIGNDETPGSVGPVSFAGKSPQTLFVDRPKKRTTSRSVLISFRSSEPGSSFRCRLDSHRSASCTSPKRYRGLEPGRHTFWVRAIDPLGRRDPTPARASWRVGA